MTAKPRRLTPNMASKEVQLAATYAEDGAFLSSASVLRALACKLIDEAERCEDIHSTRTELLNVARGGK